jgi:5-methylthioadenosine/S-adenosylhomocysteine deaminase
MPRCDLVLTNATIVTMDERFTVHADGGVAIAGDSIVGVGPEALAYEAIERHDCGGGIVMPGLVNAHTHVAMSLLRGLADDLRLDVWLMGYMMPVEREFVTPEFVALGTRLACAEMIRAGTTCFADMYYFEESVAEAAAAAGVRALCSQTVLKFPAPDAASFEDSLARARDFIARWKGHPLVVPAPAPHAPYTCTVEILRACAELAVEFGVPLHTHLAETAFEVEQSRREHGMPVVPWVSKQRLFDARVLAAHCVHVDEGDRELLASRGVHVVICPRSNETLGVGQADVPALLKAGVKLALGTDSLASVDTLDVLADAAALQRAFPDLDPAVIVRMATAGGAAALGFGDLGAIEAGHRAALAFASGEDVREPLAFLTSGHAQARPVSAEPE